MDVTPVLFVTSLYNRSLVTVPVGKLMLVYPVAALSVNEILTVQFWDMGMRSLGVMFVTTVSPDIAADAADTRLNSTKRIAMYFFIYITAT